MSEMVRSHLAKIRREFNSQVKSGMKERHVPVSLFEKLLRSAEQLESLRESLEAAKKNIRDNDMLGFKSQAEKAKQALEAERKAREGGEAVIKALTSL